MDVLIGNRDIGTGVILGDRKMRRDLNGSSESETKYRAPLEAALDAMVVVNQGGQIVLLNVQAEKQFGYSRDELLGRR
jgi:PAS domain-containing protein